MGMNTDRVYTYSKKDELFTPSSAVLPLIKYIPKNATVWECAEKKSEDGNITKELRRSGINVVTTSIHNGVDFLECRMPKGVSHVITNPPFSKKNEFLKRCYNLGKPFALLLPTDTINTKTRFALYKKYGLEIMIFNKRINYIGSKGRPPFASAWFCWWILPEKLIFEYLPE
jgi:hypothetical protein